MPTLAKLTRPKAHRVLLRQALFRRVDEARERPLVWISGPPGAGKSTLIASYVGERKCKAAWYHVDSGDDDVGTFFFYLAQAQPAKSKSTAGLPLLTPDYRADLPGFSRHFFRQFFARTPVLVLDNYHELSAGSAVHDALDHAIAEVPEGCNIVAVSRGGPPRQLVRHRLAERLSTIDARALRISLEETRAIAGLRHELDERTVRRIHAMSDGWAAGIALSLQRAQQMAQGQSRGDGHEDIEEFFDYFARQVLDALPAPLQAFLQLTSLLPTMTAAMAGSLTGRDDSEELLEDLYHRGLFTDRRSTQPPTYQYHDLFREFLARRHENATGGTELAAQLSAAAVLLEGSSQPDHAIRLFLRAGDWAAARRAILKSAATLLPQGRGASVIEWIGTIPAEIVEKDGYLRFWAGMARVRVQPVEAREPLIAAFRKFEADRDDIGQVLACAGIMRSYMYEFSDVRPLDSWIDILLKLLARHPPFVSASAELHVISALSFALSFRQPRRDIINACIGRSLELLECNVPDDDAAMVCGVLMVHLYSVGEVTMAGRFATRLQSLLARGDILPITRALGEIQIGRYCYEKCDFASAVFAFERALALISSNAISLPLVTTYSRLGLAFCALEHGDPSVVEVQRREIEAFWVPSRRMDQFVNIRLQLLLACRRRQWDAAIALARRQISGARECGVFWFGFEAQIQCALICAELGLDEEFREALAPVQALVTGTGYEHFAYQVDLAEAYYALLKGDHSACHAKLRTGLARSREDEAKVNLRRHPGLLPRLFAEAIAQGIDVDYVLQTIRTLHLHPPSRDTKDWPWPVRIYTLGGFEVLRDDHPLEYSRKAPKKTLALLKAIIALGGTGVREQRLVDAFWSDEEGDVAMRSLGAAVHRLRTLIGDGESIVQQGGTLSLDTSRTWVDAWALEALLARPGPLVPSELLALYRGSFLVEDEGEAWSVTMRERLRGRFIHAIAEAGQRLEEAGQPDRAIECYLRGLDADPVIEQFYQGLMRSYAALDRKSEALAAYQRMKRLLSVSLGLRPSAQSERLYQSLRLGA